MHQAFFICMPVTRCTPSNMCLSHSTVVASYRMKKLVQGKIRYIAQSPTTRKDFRE